VLPMALSAVSPLARAGKKRAIVLVEGRGEDAIGRIERLLDTVSVVDVNVDVQHTRVISMHSLVWQGGEARKCKP